MSTEPKINAFCESGCLYETVHKEDFDDFYEVQNDINQVKPFTGTITSIGGGEKGFEIDLSTLVNDNLASHCFVEVYGADSNAKSLLANSRASISGSTLYLRFSGGSLGVNVALYLKISKLGNSSAVYIHS